MRGYFKHVPVDYLEPAPLFIEEYRRFEGRSDSEVIEDFSGKRTALVLDDMISSGGTMQAVVENLVQKKEIREVYLGISHNLCREVALERLNEMHHNGVLKKLTVTNSIPQTQAFKELPYMSIKDLTPVFSRLIYRLHYNLPEELETAGIENEQ